MTKECEVNFEKIENYTEIDLTKEHKHLLEVKHKRPSLRVWRNTINVHFKVE